MIPSVPLCPEPQAHAGSCPGASQIGTAAASAGAGPEPYSFSGPVYPHRALWRRALRPVDPGRGSRGPIRPRTGGHAAWRSASTPTSGRVIATSSLPTIVGGVPLRLRASSVAVSRPSFLVNPTSCAPLATDSTARLHDRRQRRHLQPVPGRRAAARCTSSRRSRLHRRQALASQRREPRGDRHTAARQANIRSVVAQLPCSSPRA